MALERNIDAQNAVIAAHFAGNRHRCAARLTRLATAAMVPKSKLSRGVFGFGTGTMPAIG
jgi:hypothetical protein